MELGVQAQERATWLGYASRQQALGLCRGLGKCGECCGGWIYLETLFLGWLEARHVEEIFSGLADNAKNAVCVPIIFFLQPPTNMTIIVFVLPKCYLINFDTKAIKNLQLKLTTAVC